MADLKGVHFSAPFIKRPVATFLLSAAVILAGAVAYTLLPVSSLPQVAYPGNLGGARLPGAARRVAAFRLAGAGCRAGAVAYTLLPVSSLPQVEYPVISVGASLPGADPETMASSVATPLERQFSRIAGVHERT